MSIRSHPGPHRPSRKGPATDPDRAARCTERVRDIAEDAVTIADALLHRAFDPTATDVELVGLFETLAGLAREGTQALVVRHRSQGKPLSDLTPHLHLSEDRIRKKYNPRTIDRNLAIRTRPVRIPRPAPTTPTDDIPTTKDLLRQPRQRLARALTLMSKEARVPQRALARHMNIDPSYVSRMLSGERDVTLQHVTDIADRCRSDLNLLKPLWHAAYGIEPATDHVEFLRAYLRALHYAAGTPSDTEILASVQHPLISADVRQALEGPGVPQWHVVQQLTVALQGLPEITRPLWRDAYSTAETHATVTIQAAAFG